MTSLADDVSASPRAAAEGRTDAVTRAQAWGQAHARRMLVVDVTLLTLAVTAAYRVRFGSDVLSQHNWKLIAAAVIVLAWTASLALSRCYEPRFLGAGPEEFRRVFSASARAGGTITFLAYALQLPLSRGFVAGSAVLGTALLLLGRAGGQAWLRSQRRHGISVHRVVVVGNHVRVQELASHLHRDSAAGFRVVGACVPGGRPFRLKSDTDIPVLGSLGAVPAAIVASGADTVAVTASPGIGGEALRNLAYELEGLGVDLLVAPALTNVSGTRVSIRPVAGLPLLHVDEPELDGARRVVKAIFDRSLALAGLVVVTPVLLLLALLVRLDSAGPALFRQERVGRDGSTFTLLKLRTMRQDAEHHRDGLQHLNEHDGPLFKVRDDPRVTRVGRHLRAWSLDELPQLANVLRGDMSLVGPRPPLPSEVAEYAGHTRRRLLVKPGLTGLWQVSGRSDLSWDDSVRLDLQYVESWSLSLDIIILLRTVGAVWRRHGAY